MASLLCCLNIHMFKMIITYNYTKGKGKRYSCNCISSLIPFSALSCTDLSAVYGNVKKSSQNQKINERMHNMNSLKKTKMYKIYKQK